MKIAFMLAAVLLSSLFAQVEAKGGGGHGSQRAMAQQRLNTFGLRGQQRAFAEQRLNRMIPNGPNRNFLPPGQMKKLYRWHH